MSIVFYYAPMSNASRVHASLAELGVKHETVQYDLQKGEHKNPEFLALNPNAKVPTVVIDGTPVFESVAIQLALGERYGVEKGVWPEAGTPERLKATTWLVWGQVSLMGTMFKYISNTADYVPAALHSAPQAEQAMKDIHDLLGILEGHLAKNAYLAGERFTLADLDLVGCMQWAIYMCKLDMAVYPKTAAWVANVSARPSMKTEG
ncbi:glutathione S-transferase family protein [Chondromyces apiculatus]|uniref:Glutathione S-transferase n=1 Tax=Chondromyces apiculatus DSM 436 TaxID=1192034 RepID=A0A017THH6_9BACT|nr:glutathione S-transferase family protein [Chondromyces apiculatus]EYF08367.1 Glutathione S-transferase [Chondromyces apiculatus DSM 436]